MKSIVDSLLSTFPEADASAITGDTKLGDIPGWDSMNSVNFLMELEATFSVSLADQILTAKQTVADVADILRAKGAQV